MPNLAPEPNLVHLGREPLRFESGVTVRNGAAVVRDADQTPAALVAGQYLQGAPGPFAQAEATGADVCGLLAGIGGLNEAGRISDLDGLPECNSASARNVDRSPTDAQAGFAFSGEFSSSGALATLHPAVNNYQCPTNVNVIPLYPGRYDQTMVNKINQGLNPEEVSPGSSQTRLGQCNNQTFWFQPGVYYFDADVLHLNNKSAYFVMGAPLCWDETLPPGPFTNNVRRNGVRNPGNRLSAAVQADPRCWTDPVDRSAASFRNPFLNPEAPVCDPEESGVTFILSPRTSVVHRAGYLAMCPARDQNGRPYPALYQETSVGNTVQLDLGPAASETRDFTAASCQGLVFGQETVNLGEGNRCWNSRSYRVGMTAASGNAVASAAVHLRGFQVGSWGQDGGTGGGPHNMIEGRQTRIDVRDKMDSGNGLFCETGWLDGMPTGISGAPMTAVFDLKDPTGTSLRSPERRCSQLLNSSGQLADRELVISHRIVWFVRDLTELTLINLWLPTLSQSFVVSDAAMVLNSQPMLVVDDDPARPDPLTAGQKVTSPLPPDGTSFATVSSAPGEPAGFENIENALVHDGSLATPEMPCGEIVCRITLADVTPSTPFVHDLGIRRMTIPVSSEFEANGIDPNIEDLRLHLALDPSGVMADLSLGQFNALGGPVGELAGLILAAVDSALDPLISRARWTWFLRDMQVRAELRRPTGERVCVATSGPVTSIQEISIDLLRDGLCSGRLQSFSDLQDLDLRVSVAMPCVRDPNMPRTRCLRWGPPGSDDILQVRPPSIDVVEVRASTDSWAGTRPNSTATVDVREPSDVVGLETNPQQQSHGAAYNVMGKAWLPLHDLDLHWKGKVTADRPLFSGDLVLNGLGSRTFGATAATGIVCCNESRPETRTVLLTARIDDVDRLQVRVRYTDVEQTDPDDPGSLVTAPGHKVEVLDWRRCSTAGCGTPGA